jgi:large subunit ribosomal protein L21
VRWANRFVRRSQFIEQFMLSSEFSDSEPWAPQRLVRKVVYAVVRAGGRQEKVEVGTIVTMDRIKADKDGNVELAAVLLVDGDKITSDSTSLAKIKVTAEVLNNLRGPKIVIQKFKNKTGYKKRQGHRQELTRVQVTGIA